MIVSYPIVIFIWNVHGIVMDSHGCHMDSTEELKLGFQDSMMEIHREKDNKTAASCDQCKKILYCNKFQVILK